MLELIKSLSWNSGALIVAFTSAISTLFIARLESRFLRWLLVFGINYLVAHSLYWLPVWLGTGSSESEYSTWAFVVIFPWFLISSLVSLFIVIAVRQQIRSKRAQKSDLKN